ncbi:cysteine-rich and transmembrane domain-containing protein 1-like [Conger conger]|uniref:cysteine-rich and transmembrane domain-containing protein 1-like n=1 Tax=Conger conger TaxID=82655 RepID=UPI002A5A27A4|nr:cysteine-rich and transmembrane domain-containing protein 1-like [Conger conger]
MNPEQPPPYPGPGPTAPGYPGQGFPPNMEQPHPGAYPAYPAYPQGPTGPYPGPAGPYPGPGQPPYQGYPVAPQPQFGWQNGPPPGPMYGEAPKNTVYVVEERRRDDGVGDSCLTACWTALCCCCLWDMLT